MDFLPILFGWSLGILSTLGIDLIKKYGRKKEFEKGVLAELREIRSRLASIVFLLSPKYGPFDREVLKWVHNIFKEDAGATVSLETINTLMTRLEEWTDEQLEDWGRRRRAEQISGKSIRKYYAPFLDANIGQVSLFDVKFQRLIHQIRAWLGALNETTDEAWYYFSKTFDSTLDSTNRRIINANLDGAYKAIWDNSRITADKITEVMGEFG